MLSRAAESRPSFSFDKESGFGASGPVVRLARLRHDGVRGEKRPAAGGNAGASRNDPALVWAFHAAQVEDQHVRNEIDSDADGDDGQDVEADGDFRGEHEIVQQRGRLFRDDSEAAQQADVHGAEEQEEDAVIEDGVAADGFARVQIIENEDWQHDGRDDQDEKLNSDESAVWHGGIAVAVTVNR